MPCTLYQIFRGDDRYVRGGAADGKFTAVFEQDPSLDKVLFTLQNTTPQFNYEIDGNTVRITKK